ncbi:MAG: type II secretion system protein [Candidatus Paceibacterota bacterium]
MQNTQLTINKEQLTINQQIFATRKSAVSCQLSVVSCSLRRGYTLLELLVVIAILGLIMAITIPSFSEFRQNSALNADTMNVITLINRARLLSVSDKGDKQYGIYLSSTSSILFASSTFASSATSTRETYTLSSGITMSGTASEIVFAKVTGVASTAATTTLLGTTSSTTILIYPTGIATIK